MNFSHECLVFRDVLDNFDRHDAVEAAVRQSRVRHVVEEHFVHIATAGSQLAEHALRNPEVQLLLQRRSARHIRHGHASPQAYGVM